MMVDIKEKDTVGRSATARGFVRLGPKTLVAIAEHNIKKGNPLQAAKIAAMLAVKNTPHTLPHCHPIPIESCSVDVELAQKGVRVECTVGTSAKTGVEMEALAGVSTALLTIWDMTKYLEKDKEGQYPETAITEIRVLEKIKENVELNAYDGESEQEKILTTTES